MDELYKINNDIDNIKKEIIKTIKKEDGIRFRIFKDALNKNSFPYYESKYEDFLINDKNDDIEDDKIKSIAKHMNIDELNNYYYIVSSYIELFNNDCEILFDIRQEKRQLDVKYDDMIRLRDELKTDIDNHNAKKLLITSKIKIIIIYLIITIIYLFI
jgi:hypothetical protein